MPRCTKRVLSDADWERIRPLLPEVAPSPRGGRPRVSDRECLEGVLWVLRTGARWRDIPVDLPSGSTCWRRLQVWSGEGVLEKVHAALVNDLDRIGGLDLSELMTDATFLRSRKGGTKSA